MSNLNSPYPYYSGFVEATVLSVDPIRFMCSVKTINNKIMQEVRWLLPTGGFTESGMHFTPNIQDRVLVSTSLGYPLILGCIPRLGAYAGETSSATGAEPSPDMGTDSEVSGAAMNNPSKPADFSTGDFMFTARGGALLGVLTSGIAILKASSLAQIVMSRYDGLVRIVGRNYQRFSDVSSRVAANMRGRLYEWFGMDWDITKNQSGQERYQEVYGDVAAGEVLRDHTASTTVPPAQDARIRKQWLKDAVGNSIMIETLYNDGHLTFVVQSWNTAPTPAIVNSNTQTNVDASSNTTVTDGTNISHITITPASLVVASTDGGGNTSTITLSPTSILVDNNGKAKGTFGAASTVVEFNGKGKGTFTDTSAIIDYNGTSTGTFDASQASLTSGGHFCTVTAGGVALG
jgi:hypothetical protein